jgi:hypothetical protein
MHPLSPKKIGQWPPKEDQKVATNAWVAMVPKDEDFCVHVHFMAPSYAPKEYRQFPQKAFYNPKSKVNSRDSLPLSQLKKGMDVTCLVSWRLKAATGDFIWYANDVKARQVSRSEDTRQQSGSSGSKGADYNVVGPQKEAVRKEGKPKDNVIHEGAGGDQGEMSRQSIQVDKGTQVSIVVFHFRVFNLV